MDRTSRRRTQHRTSLLVATLGFATLGTAILAGCDASSPEPRPAAECAPECNAGGPPYPWSSDPETTCFDGCNWCTCTTQGPIDCTARYCSDGGV